MVFGGEVEGDRFPKVAQGLVVLLAAPLQVVVGEVGQGQHHGVEFRVHPAQLLVVGGNDGLQLRHALEHRLRVLPGLFQLGDGLGDLILLRLHLLRGEDDVPALLVQLQDAVDLLVAVHLFLFQGGFDPVGVLFHALDV